MKRVCILLASYQGEAYIQQQLTSLQQQTYQDWVAFIRDDQSTDNTQALIQAVAAEDSRFQIINDDLGNLGSNQNFAVLMYEAAQQDFDYIFFADQDDVWEKDKIEIQLAELEKLTEKFGSHTPLLTYCNLQVVDQTLQAIHTSFHHYQGLHHPRHFSLSHLIGQNIVTGCAMAINRSLLRCCLPVPQEALVHDWWIAIFAAALGEVSYTSRSLIKYRQHAHNQVGTTRISPQLLTQPEKLKALFIKNSQNFIRSLTQARSVSYRLTHLRAYSQARCARSYASLLHQSLIGKIKALYTYKFQRQGKIRKLLFILRLFFIGHILRQYTPKLKGETVAKVS